MEGRTHADAHQSARTPRIGDIPHSAKPYIDVASNEQITEDQISGLPETAAKSIRDAVAEYESRETIEARCAKDADRLECLMQAVEYRESGYTRVDGWIDSSRARIQTDFGKRLAEAAFTVPICLAQPVDNAGTAKEVAGGLLQAESTRPDYGLEAAVCGYGPAAGDKPRAGTHRDEGAARGWAGAAGAGSDAGVTGGGCVGIPQLIRTTSLPTAPPSSMTRWAAAISSRAKTRSTRIGSLPAATRST